MKLLLFLPFVVCASSPQKNKNIAIFPYQLNHFITNILWLQTPRNIRAKVIICLLRWKIYSKYYILICYNINHSKLVVLQFKKMKIKTQVSKLRTAKKKIPKQQNQYNIHKRGIKYKVTSHLQKGNWWKCTWLSQKSLGVERRQLCWQLPLFGVTINLVFALLIPKESKYSTT